METITGIALNIAELKVGLDGELEDVVNDVIVYARKSVLRQIYKNPSVYKNSVGLDGSGAQFELRPTPGTPERVVKSVRTLINKLLKLTDVSVRGNRFPLGCHIHFGIKFIEKRNFGQLNKIVENKIVHVLDNPSNDFIKLLDHYIGKICRKGNGTARGWYSDLGKYRAQPHGFEYRSTPSAIMYTPSVLKTILTVAFNLATLYYSGKTIKTEGRQANLSQLIDIGITEDEAKAYLKEMSNASKQKRTGNIETHTKYLRAAWGKPKNKTGEKK